MGKIGNGYGSECHLLRYLGRHRKLLDERALDALGRGDRIEWLDFEFDPKRDTWQDAELKGMAFLELSAAQEAAWKAFWPQGRGTMNWDAVGWVHGEGEPELLLVEAKANVREIESSCGAGEKSRRVIQAAFGRVQAGLGVPTSADWLTGYYQLANRIAVLWFLVQQGIPANLMMIYFTGDMPGPGRACPTTAAEWGPALEAQDAALGLPAGHQLAGRISKLFLPVAA